MGAGSIPLMAQTPDIFGEMQKAQTAQAMTNQNYQRQQEIAESNVKIQQAQEEARQEAYKQNLIRQCYQMLPTSTTSTPTSASTPTPTPTPNTPTPAASTPATPTPQAATPQAATPQAATPTPTPAPATPHNTHPDISKSMDLDSPSFASVYTATTTDPKTGATINHTFNREAYLQGLFDYTDAQGNHPLASNADEMIAKFITQDRNAYTAQLDLKHKQNSLVLGGLYAFSQLTPNQQKLQYADLKKQAEANGTDTSTWPPDVTNEQGQAWLQNRINDARVDAEKSKEVLEDVDKRINDKKADSEIKVQAAQAANQYAEAAKNRAEAAKLQAETVGAPGTGGVVTKLEDVPIQYRGTVDKLLSNEITLTQIPAKTRPGEPTRSQYISWATQIARATGTEFHPQQAIQQQKALADFAPNGTSGKAITSLGAFAEHIQLLRQYQKALAQHDMPTINALQNKISTTFGGAAADAYKTLAHVTAGEADKFMSGNNPTESGAAKWEGTLSLNMSPEQAAAVFGGLTKAIQGKLQPLDQAYNNATNGRKHLVDSNLLTPAAKELAVEFKTPTQDVGANTPTNPSSTNPAWKPINPSGTPDIKTQGQNTRFPDAVWVPDGPSGKGWYHKAIDGRTIVRVE